MQKKDITLLNEHPRYGSYIKASYPSKCPRCHTHISPVFISGKFIKNEVAELVFQCTFSECNGLFISKYIKIEYAGSNNFEYCSSQPLLYKKKIFSDELSGVSPDFIDIYNQSMEAFSRNMHQIAGVGLRKSLEFLIKDFIIQNKPEKEEAVKKQSLSQCIEKYVKDERVKDLSKRAVWIGNDETHYIKKWHNKDIDDLKVLIRLVVNYIESDILASKYIDDMQQKKDPTSE
jgi:hypothetical protein